VADLEILIERPMSNPVETGLYLSELIYVVLNVMNGLIPMPLRNAVKAVPWMA